MDLQFNTNVYHFTLGVVTIILEKFNGTVVGSEEVNMDLIMGELFGDFKPSKINDNHLKGETLHIKMENDEEKMTITKEQYEEYQRLKECPKQGDKKLFRDIVFQDTGYEVVPATQEQIDDAKTNAILARNHQIDVNENIFKGKDGKPRKRYNECGNDMENVLKISSDEKLKGLGQAAGYPDLENCICEYYLECKVANSKSMDTSFRSFYLSTLTKIKKSQPHLLVCFKHHDGKLSKGDEPIVIDLYDLELTLKQEWNASNKELYITI